MRRRIFFLPLQTIAVLALVSIAAAPRASAQRAAAPAAVDERGPLERRAVPITPENPIPKRVAATMPLYPPDVTDRTVRGTVTLRVTLDALGHVGEVRQAYRPDPSMIPAADGGVTPAPALSTPFVKAALDAVRMWQYEPPAQAPIAFFVRLHFTPARPADVIWHDARPPVTLAAGSTTPGPPAGIPGGVAGEVIAGAPPPPPQAPVRVGGNVPPPKKIKDVQPVYPSAAVAARIQGVVIIEATIAPQGNVVDARVLRSIPLLDQAALDAVRQWEFTPTLLNGQPVAIMMSVTVNFALASRPAPPEGASRPGGAAPPQ